MSGTRKDHRNHRNNQKESRPAGRGRALILALLLFPAPALAITEAQFIDKVLARDKLLEEAQIGLDIKQIELDASRDNYANWKAELSVDVGYERTHDKQTHTARSTGALTTSPYIRDHKDTPREVSLDFKKRFLSNPSSFSFGIARSKDTYRNTRYDRDFSARCGKKTQRASDKCEVKQVYEDQQRYGGYVSTYYAQLKYPLLRHDSNAESLKAYHRNVYDLQDQKLSFLETREDFLNDRLDDYLAWVLSHRRVEINAELLSALRRQQPADETETALLASVIAQTENARHDAEIQRQSVVDRLAVLLDDASLISQVPRFDLHKRVDLVSDNVRTYLTRHSRALKRINIDMRLNQLEIAHHRNRLLPSLNLILRGEKEFDQVGTATVQYDDDTTDYRASLEFSYPLGGSITTNAELAKRALTARRLEIGYAERMERIQGDLQRLASLLNFDEGRLVDAINAAKRSTQLEQEKYQQGDASLRDLVQAQRDQRDAKLDHLENLVEYQLNRIQYDNLLDRMLGLVGH